MTDALIVALADAVAAHINGGAFTQPVVATVRFDTELSLEQLDQLEHVDVTVIPSVQSRAFETRGSMADELSIDLGIRARIAPKSTAAVRGLLKLAEQIEQHCTRFAPTPPQWEGPRITFAAIETDPIFDPEELRVSHMFFGVRRITFRAHGLEVSS